MSDHGMRGHARWLQELSRQQRGLLALAAGAGLVTGLLVIMQAGLIALIVHRVIVAEAPIGELLPLFGGLVGVVAARAMSHWGQQAAGIAAAARIRRRLRAALLERIAALGPAHLAGEHSADLAQRTMEQVDAIDGYFARYRPQLVVAMGVPLAIAAVALTQDWIVALLLILAAPLIPLFMALVGMGAEHLNREQFETVNRLASHFLDRVRGLSTLRLFGRGQDAVAEVGAMADEYRRRNMRTLRVAFLSSAVLEFFASVAIASIAIYIGFGLLGYIEFGNAPELTLFSGLFLLLLAPDFFQPLRTLAQTYHDRAAALGAASGLRSLLERPGPHDHGVTIETERAAVAISIADLHFAWPERGPVFRGAHLDIAAGERVALIGPSGSGKSTLLQLLAGFVQPDRGEIRIDGEPAGRIGPVAWVGQRPFLMSGTIAANIALARPAATGTAVRAAAEQAGVTAFTDNLPDGLETAIGEGGLGLSGGQGQRIAVARAFLAQAPLLLLDEPTASLDTASERMVLNALRHLAAEGRTLIVASHHDAVRAMVDRVIEIDAGVVREVAR
ncbi:thiol reductant ABC exporter subunit CydD [Halofilum ochraceum]|uniref:thiol reductant ABC exporter subunit CydD n=1 Tax=Halofilum ochraceum TaxID=1611323 RepID=UPI00082EC7A5|nr:thiol reductant ABC exporter subunit CydD [Halofilum ochraceum]